MAVVTLYMSDRDKEKTFSDKKEAEAYDKMLELASNVSLWIQKEVADLSEEQIEKIGLLIAQNKDIFAKALKGKSEVLLKEADSKPEDQKPEDSEENDSQEKSN